MVSDKRSYEKMKQRLELMEQALREKEKTVSPYYTLFDSASDAMFIHNIPSGKIKEVNRKAQEMFGFSKDEFLGLDILSLSEQHSQYSHERVEKNIALVVDGKSLLFEWRCRKKNGTLFWVEVNLRKAIFEDEEVMIAIVRDISSRKKTEKELKRFRQLSNTIQRLGKIGAWEVDIASQMSFWTEEVYRIHDIEPNSINTETEDLHFKRSLACYDPDDRPVVSEALEKCIGKGIPFQLEFPFTTVKGRRIWIQTEGKRINTKEDGCRVMGYFRDITASKKQEETLRANELKYKTILQTAVDGFLLLDDNGRILEVNSAYCRMSGYTEKELLSMDVMDLEAQMGPDEVSAKMDELKKCGYGRFGTKHRRKDGGLYDVEICATIISIPEGRHVNFIRDLSVFKEVEKEKKVLQEQLNQIQKLESIGRLAGGVAHDLNNLLTPVLGYAQMLMENKEGKISPREKLQSIYDAGTKARKLVGQLLAFSRKQTLEFRLLDVDAVLLGFDELLRRTMREDVHLNMVASPDTKTVMADQTQLEQIVMNLTVNAADAMPDGGVLTIETTMALLDETYASNHPGVVPGRYVLMSFTDTGHGMDQETCSKIFEPFYSTKGKQGTGLGLATVYGIVKQHSGNIWAYSEIGKGSVFKVYLPHVPGKETENLSKRASFHELTGSETILLAEDNDGVRNLASDMLRMNGYTVFSAPNGNKALELWAAMDESVDLLVTDVIMPEMNGKELFESLHSIDPDIRVLYLSGYPDDAISRHGILDPGVHYIQKPFSLNDFLLKVRQVLDGKM